MKEYTETAIEIYNIADEIISKAQGSFNEKTVEEKKIHLMAQNTLANILTQLYIANKSSVS
jgi:hypothetical protein